MSNTMIIFVRQHLDNMVTLSIHEQLCFSTTRIETEDINDCKYSGTGFFYHLNINDKIVPLLITNKHVVRNMKKGIFQLTTADANGYPIYTKHHPIIFNDNFEKHWIFHPDSNVDLCVCPINPLLEQAEQLGVKLFYRTLNNRLIPTPEQIRTFDAIEEIIMIGYPNGLWDSVNNMPIIRRGITATPIGLNYEGRKEFIIDAACFPGSSGSPVLLCNVGGYTDKKGNLNWGASRLFLLGILYAGPQLTVTGDIKVVTIPDAHQKALSISSIPNNLGYIIKSERILDFVPIIKSLIAK